MRITVKPVCNGPVFSGNPVYYCHPTTSQSFQLPYTNVFSAKLSCSGHPAYNVHLAISRG